MWLFTTMGFFSATRSAVEPDKFQIRARVRNDLVCLMDTLGFFETILETPEADYRYRIIVDPETFGQICAALPDQVTYTNFKGAMAQFPEQKAKLPALHDVWAVMQRLQPSDPYAGHPELFQEERKCLECFGTGENLTTHAGQCQACGGDGKHREPEPDPVVLDNPLERREPSKGRRKLKSKIAEKCH